MLSLAIFVTTILFSAPKVNSANCPTSCGNISIPFPFGTSPDCSLNESFLITCNHTYNPPKPFLHTENIEVHHISLDGQIKVSSVASDCNDTSGAQGHCSISEINSHKFLISNLRNNITPIGCDTYKFGVGFDPGWKQLAAGYVSWCDNIDSVVNVVNGPWGASDVCRPFNRKRDNISMLEIHRYKNCTRGKNPYPHSFTVLPEDFELLYSDLKMKDYHNRKSVPVVFDWFVGHVTCQEALRNASTYGCRANHSECRDSSKGIGYLCSCLTGFEGNPYLLDGCQDINECATLKPCEGTCTNLPGSYLCSCPKGFEGDGKKDGDGCHSKSFMVAVIGSSWIFWRRKQTKVTNLRKKLFHRNGGQLLNNMLSNQETLVIFTAEDLKKAANNYDETRVLYGEHTLGITYYGILGNNREVTIQKCDMVEECNIEVFVRILITLSRIHHRNVLSLIGCCLETQVPLLVYEFIKNKTLHDYIHDDVLAGSLSWDVRLRIAAQIAGGLYCMHYGSQAAIIHGNINSYSILLGHDYNVKLHDFAPLRSCPIVDILGYLDPEYLISGLLTVKSDVYSFGVVLAELLTGEKARDMMNGGDDLRRILDHRMETEGKMGQITQVAKLADKCLSDSSEDRPTMREVVVALEVAMNKYSSSITANNNTSQGTNAPTNVR